MMRIVKAGLFSSVLLALVSGCDPFFASSSDNDLSMVISLSPSEHKHTQIDGSSHSIDLTSEESLSVSFIPKEGLPKLVVTFDLVGELPGEFYSEYYYLCSVSQNNEEIQVFKIHSYEILQPSQVHFIDSDFDGFLDMGVHWISGSTNWEHSYFKFNPETGTFEETVFFSASSRGIKFFPDTKQAMVTILDGYIPCIKEVFQYVDGNYSRIRTEYINRDFKTGQYSIRIVEYADNGEQTEIYSVTLTEDEYDSDLTEWEVRENYLLFGMENAP